MLHSGMRTGRCTFFSSLGAQQKSHAQFAENTFLRDNVDTVFQFSFDRLVSLVQSPHTRRSHDQLRRFVFIRFFEFFSDFSTTPLAALAFS